MKTKNKLFFFFFIFLSFSFLIIPIAFAEDITTTPVLGTNLLTIRDGTFSDSTPGDSIRSLKSSVGGKDLLAFENLGEISYDESTNTIVYGGILTFGAEANAYTSVLCENAYPVSGGTNFDKQTEHMFLSWQKWNIWGKIKSYIYTINYREIEYGSLYSHNYDGILPLTVGIDPGLFISSLGTLSIAGQTFNVPKITSDIKSVQEVAKRSGEVGSYVDQFTDETEGDKEVSVEVILPSTAWSFDVQKVTDWFNSEMKPVLTLKGTKISTIQQSVVDLTLNTYDYGGVQDSVVVPYKVHLQPEMYKITQDIRLNYGHFHWNVDWNDYCEDPIIDGQDIKRNLAMHVTNVFVHTYFRIKVEIAMTCKFDAKLSQSILDDPNLKISDRIWESTIYGDKDVKLRLPGTLTWYMILIIIVVAIVGLYIFIKIGVPLIRRKIMRRGYNDG